MKPHGADGACGSASHGSCRESARKARTSVSCGVSNCLLRFFFLITLIFCVFVGFLFLFVFLALGSLSLRSEFPPRWVSGPGV